MAKNRHGNNKNNSRPNGGGDMRSLLVGAGLSVSEPEEAKEDEKKTGLVSKSEDRKSTEKKAVFLNVEEGPHAPYNFIPFSDRVLKTHVCTEHNIIKKELYSGYISYRLTANTPLMVDSGDKTFYCHKNGSYAVPGSTMRGLIRNHAQVLGFSNPKRDVDDYYLMYRDVASGALQKQYRQILGVEQKEENGVRKTFLNRVRAGYLKREGNRYVLYKNIGDSDGRFAEGKANYYVVSEVFVLNKASDDFSYLVKGNKLQNKKIVRDRINKKWIETPNQQYHPYWEEISYQQMDGKVVGIEKEGLQENGCMLSSGYLNKKKVFYVIPEADYENLVPEVTDEKMAQAVLAYEADYNRKKKGLGNNADFFALPRDGETRAVFYIYWAGRLYFGYTPYLRLMYNYSIARGIKVNVPEQEEELCEYVSAIFGFANEEQSYKSKVFFTDAILTNEKKCRSSDQNDLILAEPKPTSYLEYVEQENGKLLSTYNDKDFTLRGAKQYWLQEKTNSGMQSDKEKVKSHIAPIEPKSEFVGEVRFHNLTKEELGLILWSICLEEDSQVNLGKAKAYGYGRAKIDQVSLNLQNTEDLYKASPEVFTMNPYRETDRKERDSYIEEYQKMLADWLCMGNKDETRVAKDIIMAYSSIKTFFRMKSLLVDERIASYMPIEGKKYQTYKTYKSGGNPLPSVDDIYEYVMQKGK